MWRVIALGVLLGVCFTTMACDDSTSTPGDGVDSGVSIPDGGTGHEQPPTCDVQAPTACPSPAPRYADVAPIFEQRCVICHDTAPGGPWPLNDYGHVSDWQETIRASQLDCSMPPSDAGVRITLEERLAILQWIRCGLPK
ncbi:hypothetical protein JY651_20525 [Pyxidicoccus parkwayensis]|uniref:Cytochrome c domain-containing protein n=1 Tax=Pyxidicoccus parkwayensis TaxID=2813578 RepID=A0ABX7P9P5_9BACT|nr:hypothetical protein [Pyxidicoccus parkwaysis]QSQ27148.1 hypothetical protein JY651_20525 [Pyxidicoccus parkwaysis]